MYLSICIMRGNIIEQLGVEWDAEDFFFPGMQCSKSWQFIMGKMMMQDSMGILGYFYIYVYIYTYIYIYLYLCIYLVMFFLYIEGDFIDLKTNPFVLNRLDSDMVK